MEIRVIATVHASSLGRRQEGGGRRSDAEGGDRASAGTRAGGASGELRTRRWDHEPRAPVTTLQVQGSVIGQDWAKEEHY